MFRPYHPLLLHDAHPPLPQPQPQPQPHPQPLSSSPTQLPSHPHLSRAPPVSFHNGFRNFASSSRGPSFLPRPSDSSPASAVPLPPRDRRPAYSNAWDDHDLPAERPQTRRQRRFSEQDLRTRTARASLTSARKHKASSSYPIYPPVPNPSSSVFNHRYLPWGYIPTMERPQISARSSSSTIVTTRSSVDSRHRSPLSISSSANYSTPRSSHDSSLSEIKPSSEFRKSRSQIPPTTFPIKRSTEPILPTYARHGSMDRTQRGQAMLPPQRMVWAPSSPTRLAPRTNLIPGAGFKKLPEEILLVILGELKKLHFDTGSLSCATCWMRDLVNLGLSGKKWWGVARCILYEDIQLNGIDSSLHTKKRFKMKYGTRLRLLRRTLRNRPDLAVYVKSLKVPSMPDLAKTKKEQDEYLELVATIIMACPNLERLPGFYPAYNHEFSRFIHALSSRQKLTERVWIINPSMFKRQHRYHLLEDEDFLNPIRTPGPLLPEQCIDFLTYHNHWTNLQTLILHCNPGGTIDSPLFTDIFSGLPALENLLVSSFPAPSFNDTTLCSLPPLKSLRLESLSGITPNGLSTYASLTTTDTLAHLSLIHLPLYSLPVLARLFSHLPSLTSFTILQSQSLSLPIGVEIYLHPYLASASLQFLHWEFISPDDALATSILAKSISSNGFPALRTLRAPTDPDGMLQRLCRPRERIELPGDRYRNLGFSQSTPNTSSSLPSDNSSSSPYSVKSPTKSTFSLSLSRSHTQLPSLSSVPSTLPYYNSNLFNPPSPSLPPKTNTYNISTSSPRGISLPHARLLAQSRINNARSHPAFHIIIWSPTGEFVERFAVGGYLGDIRSRIAYVLMPSVEGEEVGVWALGIGEGSSNGRGLLEDGGWAGSAAQAGWVAGDRSKAGDGTAVLNEERAVKDGCMGSWNLEEGSSSHSTSAASPHAGLGARAGRSISYNSSLSTGNGGSTVAGKERWWHMERARWRDVHLEKLF